MCAASIYETLVSDPSAVLPDQGDLPSDSVGVWVPGAYEGTLLRTKKKIAKNSWINHGVVRDVRRFALDPSEGKMKAVEKSFSTYTAIALTDPVLSIMSGMKLPADKLHDAAVALATKSGKREAVKFSIALLADQRSRVEGSTDADAEIIKTLSLCEEFTLFGAVALKNILPKEKADAVLLELAGRLSGWGKLALMYELDYTLPEVRDFALCRGCRNTVGLPYLANVCAIKGKMRDYLAGLEESGAAIDEEHFTGIIDIFTGLLTDDPTNDGIFEYPDAKESARLFRAIVARSSDSVKNRAVDVLKGLHVKRIG